MTTRSASLDALAIQQDALKFAEQMLNEDEESEQQGGESVSSLQQQLHMHQLQQLQQRVKQEEALVNAARGIETELQRIEQLAEMGNVMGMIEVGKIVGRQTIEQIQLVEKICTQYETLNITSAQMNEVEISKQIATVLDLTDTLKRSLADSLSITKMAVSDSEYAESRQYVQHIQSCLKTTRNYNTEVVRAARKLLMLESTQSAVPTTNSSSESNVNAPPSLSRKTTTTTTVTSTPNGTPVKVHSRTNSNSSISSNNSNSSNSSNSSKLVTAPTNSTSSPKTRLIPSVSLEDLPVSPVSQRDQQQQQLQQQQRQQQLQGSSPRQTRSATVVAVTPIKPGQHMPPKSPRKPVVRQLQPQLQQQQHVHEQQQQQQQHPEQLEQPTGTTTTTLPPAQVSKTDKQPFVDYQALKMQAIEKYEEEQKLGTIRRRMTVAMGPSGVGVSMVTQSAPVTPRQGVSRTNSFRKMWGLGNKNNSINGNNNSSDPNSSAGIVSAPTTPKKDNAKRAGSLSNFLTLRRSSSTNNSRPVVTSVSLGDFPNLQEGSAQALQQSESAPATTTPEHINNDSNNTNDNNNSDNSMVGVPKAQRNSKTLTRENSVAKFFRRTLSRKQLERAQSFHAKVEDVHDKQESTQAASATAETTKKTRATAGSNNHSSSGYKGSARGTLRRLFKRNTDEQNNGDKEQQQHDMSNSPPSSPLPQHTLQQVRAHEVSELSNNNDDINVTPSRSSPLPSSVPSPSLTLTQPRTMTTSEEFEKLLEEFKEEFDVCHGCDRVITEGENNGECTTRIQNKLYHRWCVDCKRCGQVFMDSSQVICEGPDGNTYCEADFDLEFPSCPTCTKRVGTEVTHAMGRKYHPQCFVCDTCHKAFATTVDGKFYADEDKPYCENCYYDKLGMLCQSCKNPIFGGKCINANGLRFHAQHFECYHCKHHLLGQGYYLHSQKVYCRGCHLAFFG